MLNAFSLSLISAAPMPPCVLKDFGQPMFTSTPEISGRSLYTAKTAVSGLLVPIYNMNLGRSSGRILITRL